MAGHVELYTCEEDDRVDLIAFKRFGEHGMEGAIFEANPGLAARGPCLPLGLVVRIPVPVVGDRIDLGNLWSSRS